VVIVIPSNNPPFHPLRAFRLLKILIKNKKIKKIRRHKIKGAQNNGKYIIDISDVCKLQIILKLGTKYQTVWMYVNHTNPIKIITDQIDLVGIEKFNLFSSVVFIT